MRERDYQAKLIRRLKAIFPGCVILKNDANYLQGIPDLIVLFNDRWFALEVKVSRKASRQPNQDYYVELLNDMSFAAYICPETEDQVLDEIQRSLKLKRTSRISKS